MTPEPTLLHNGHQVHLYTVTVPTCKLHQRYIDVVGIVCCSCIELEEYIAFVSNFHPALQFKCTTSETEVPFLDINLRFSGDRICASIHCKAIDTHRCLHYDSSHPCHCKESLPYSQLLCLRRICSDQANTNPCQHPRCPTCGYISSETDLRGPKHCLTIKDLFTCLSSGLIYCISCHRCPAICIDKTGCTLKECFGEHLQSINKNAPGFHIAEHFSSNKQTAADAKRLDIGYIFGTSIIIHRSLL